MSDTNWPGLSTAAYRNDEGIWIDPNDPAFSLPATQEDEGSDLPKIYLFSNSRNGDGVAYAMAEDGTVLGSHWCSHWGYMRHDLHDRSDRKTACEAHYPDGYAVVVLATPGSLPPVEVLERNRAQVKADAADGAKEG
jgi:hypothetical protein